jgi:hypothetical protein
VLSGLDSLLEVFVAEEGQESAFLLTSFGIAVPALVGVESGLPLADVFVVNGPGFATGIDVVAPDTPAVASTGVALVVGFRETGGLPGEGGGTDAALVPAGEERPAGDASGGAKPAVGDLGTPPPDGGGGSEPPGAPPEAGAEAAEPEAATARLRLGLEEALRNLPDAAAVTPGGAFLDPAAVRAACQVLRDWLPASGRVLEEAGQFLTDVGRKALDLLYWAAPQVTDTTSPAAGDPVDPPLGVNSDLYFADASPDRHPPAAAGLETGSLPEYWLAAIFLAEAYLGRRTRRKDDQVFSRSR